MFVNLELMFVNLPKPDTKTPQISILSVWGGVIYKEFHTQK